MVITLLNLQYNLDNLKNTQLLVKELDDMSDPVQLEKTLTSIQQKIDEKLSCKETLTANESTLHHYVLERLARLPHHKQTSTAQSNTKSTPHSQGFFTIGEAATETTDMNEVSEMQGGLIRHHLRTHIEERLTYYFLKLHPSNVENPDDSYERLATFIKEAYHDQDVHKHQMILSQRLSLTQSAALPAIKYELWGILNADVSVLNKLSIVNNIRDETKIPVEHFPESLKTQIRAYSSKALEKILNREAQLKGKFGGFFDANNFQYSP